MRNQIPYDHITAILRAKEPSMRYKGDIPFSEWQKNVREKLAELLGYNLIKPVEDNMFKIEYECQRDGFKEIRFSFQSEEGYFVPCHLWVPDGAGDKVPLMICLQGHSTGMHISLGRPKYEGDQNSISGGDRDFCVRTIKEGVAALAIEQRCFGECGGLPKGINCRETAFNMLMIGRTVIGARVWDISRAIDAVTENFSFLDSDNIICMGNSGGGTATIYASCLEERIKVSMPSCAFCTYDDSICAMEHCHCNYIPGIRTYLDMGDLAGLIAPRDFIVVCGKDDPIFPIHGVKAAYAEAERLYAEAGAADKISLVIGDGDHRFYADAAWTELHKKGIV